MTEKEFLDRFRSEGLANWSMQAARRGLALAKEAMADAGAEFDPEPMELPLVGWSYPASGAGMAFDHTIYLPGRRPLGANEAREICRRCNKWPDLTKLWESYRDGREEPVSYAAAAAGITSILKGRE